MTIVIDEFKTMLVLAGNKRLPQYEEEIFACEELTTLYLHNLCKGYVWYRPDRYNAELAFFYVAEVLDCRWPEVEALIMTVALDAYYYARDVIKGRWPEAEAIIATDPLYARRYAEDNRGI